MLVRQLRERFSGFGERLRDWLLLGTLISGADYVAATRMRRSLCRALATAMRDVDVLLTAATAGEAPVIHDVPKWSGFDKPSLMMPFNISGIPTMPVCIGFGARGLPLAMQIAGKPFAEATVLRVAHTYEKLTTWRSRRP